MAKARVSPHLHLNKYYHEPGTAPGTLVRHPAFPTGDFTIRVIRYSAQGYSESVVDRIEDCWADRGEGQTTWIDIAGNYGPELLNTLGRHYNLHPLSLEDSLNLGQRPKWEDYGRYDFLVMYTLAGEGGMATRQVSIFLLEDTLITLENQEIQSFELVRERLRLHQGSGRIREAGPDYLCYSICDTLVDQFFPRLEDYGEKLDSLEDDLLVHPDRQLLNLIHQMKRDLLVLGKVAWAEREVVGALERQASSLIQPETTVYLRDCYDHIVQIIDMIETYRDITTGVLDTYLSSVSNQMNAVMKTLTIIATIFIPLTFIVGVYGMNFNPAVSRFNMPELNARYGYPVVWAVMIIIAATMVVWFKRKKWL